MMKASEFVAKLKDIANNYKTLYVMGGFGAPMTESNKKVYIEQYSYNKKSARKAMIEAATADTFGFDCVCLVKGVLWGWNGDASKTYGGAVYQSNDVPDTTIENLLKSCSDVSDDFSNIVPGEFVTMKGHCGVYIGDGLAVECTPKWENKVQITAVGNIGDVEGYNTRTWVSHGKLPYVDYSDVVPYIFLRKGDVCENVKTLQTALIALGYSCGSCGVDGSFGPATEIAVKNYQCDHGYEANGTLTEDEFNEIIDKSVELNNPQVETKPAEPEVEPEKTEEEVDGESAQNVFLQIIMKLLEIVKIFVSKK